MDRLFFPEPDADDAPGATRPGGGPAAPAARPGRDPTGATGGHEASSPLAARMRPRTVEEVVGQRDLLSPGRPLRAAIDAGRPHAMLLHGPPGSGKTTLARIVADAGDAVVERLQAVDAGKAEVREVLARAAERRRAAASRATVLFIDEIHRFNRTQQDALLPAVEEGVVTLVAATTEAPWSAVSPALRSRLRIHRLRALDESDVLVLLRRAVERGETVPPAAAAWADEDGPVAVVADDDALVLLAGRSAGDARTALGALEAAADLAWADAMRAASAPLRDGDEPPADASAGPDHAPTADADAADAPAHPREIRLTAAHAGIALDRATVVAGADQHHDLLSAFIKSIRGSDADAAVYYLAGMLSAGEDPRTVARRLVVAASEDIGLADPMALPIAVAAAEVVATVGMPECRIALSHATVRLALAPKSAAAYRAIDAALEHVAEHGVASPPDYLRGRVSEDAKPGAYDYPHDRPGGVTRQEYMPATLVGERFLLPAEHETALLERLAAARRARGQED